MPDTRLVMTLDDRLLEKIEDYRYSQRVPSRSEAIRRLLWLALGGHCDDIERANPKLPPRHNVPA